MENFAIFKDVSPNTVTITGFFVSIVTYLVILHKLLRLRFVLMLLMFRWLCDLLDGAIARYYDKITVIGGYLDTLSDFAFFFLMNHFLALKIGYVFLLDSIFVATYWYVIYTYNSFHDHDGLKVYSEKPSINDIVPFMINNSSLLYLGVYAILTCIV
jgi:phosphatidylglycerophosphate synthase